MKQRLMALSLCLLLLLSLCSCQKEEKAAAKEESGGTGFGAVQKSALTEQDLYFMTYSTTRERIHQQLGTPQEALMTEDGVELYTLKDGQTLKITYSQQETVQEAIYTDQKGEQKNFFEYLTALGILQTVGGHLPSAPVPDPSEPDQTPEQENPENPQLPEAPSVQQPVKESFFSDKTYNMGVALQILKEGASRETVVSALGKPNRFSSVNFANDGYIIDVYVMDNGTILYLDYGYLRSTLRAVRKVEGSTIEDLMGQWGPEEKPQNFYRTTKNRTVFSSVKKESTPAAIFQRFGEPHWLEGEENHYQAAYKLLNDTILYLDFGAGNVGLSSAYLRAGDGSISIFALR